MNVFQYAATEERNFEVMASQSGYTRISTFYSDLSIAEFCQLYMRDRGAVNNTFKSVCENWIDDYKMFTEFVICLNWKIWKWYEKNPTLGKLYNTLWERAQKMYYNKYKDNETAMSYYYKVTD